MTFKEKFLVALTIQTNSVTGTVQHLVTVVLSNKLMPPSSDTDNFRRILSGSHDIVVIAGAGLSAGSGEISSDFSLKSSSLTTGIPTFRTGNGLWRSHDVTKLATPEAFATNPALVWQFYHERRRSYVCPFLSFIHSCSVEFPSVLSASPNQAHYALALLSIPSYLQVVAPNCTRYTFITQNVDGLSTRAYREVMSRHSQSDNNTVPRYLPNFFGMHGRLLDTLCTSCGHRKHNDANSLGST